MEEEIFCSIVPLCCLLIFQTCQWISSHGGNVVCGPTWAESVGRQLTFEIKTISYWRKNKTTVLSVNVDIEPYWPTQL